MAARTHQDTARGNAVKTTLIAGSLVKVGNNPRPSEKELTLTEGSFMKVRDPCPSKLSLVYHTSSSWTSTWERQTKHF